jgi:hypothetical protein
MPSRGYDLNTVEFAVQEGVPYAIDFLNPAPDADYQSVGPGELFLDREKPLQILLFRKPRATNSPRATIAGPIS